LSTHEAAKVNILEYSEITKGVDLGVAIEVMRQALLAQASGECDTPMPMHLDIEPTRGEVHIKASARRGAPYYVVKVASGFPDNSSKGLSTGNGLMMLFSAETGQAEAILLDQGYLTDVRTAAVTALMARELGRRDKTIGILGSGIQARLQVDLHREVLDLEQVWIWGRTPAHVTACAVDLRDRHPDLMISIADSPSQVAEMSRLVVTVTASHEPLLSSDDVRSGTLISAVGSDSPGKHELDPRLLDRAEVLIVDSRVQCEKLGELQHAPEHADRAVEAGDFCRSPLTPSAEAVVVCDFTGLGVEDLFIATATYDRARMQSLESEDR
jgi:ornithine cyclodeaminase